MSWALDRTALEPGLDLELCRLLVGWDNLEQRNGARAVIDFNVSGVLSGQHFDHRYDVLRALIELKDACEECSLAFERVAAHEAYLRALMGQQLPFGDYIRATQGVVPSLFDESYLDVVRADAEQQLVEIGVNPREPVHPQLDELDPPLPLVAAEKSFHTFLDNHLHGLETLINEDLSFDLTIIPVEVDEYWSYWVDGTASRFRLRLNQRKASFSLTECLQFTFHELIAHCGQMHAWSGRISEGALAAYFGITTVHTPEQFMLEGLAQTLPLLIRSEVLTANPILQARMTLMRYELLIRNNLHYMINRFAPIEECLAYYEQRSFRRKTLDLLNDLVSRSVDVLYRSYQYVYPVSCEFFWDAAEGLTPDACAQLVRSCFREPHTAEDLRSLVASLQTS